MRLLYQKAEGIADVWIAVRKEGLQTGQSMLNFSPLQILRSLNGKGALFGERCALSFGIPQPTN